MRLVVKKNGSIQPFLLEGLDRSFGSLVPSALVFYVYNVVYTSMNNNLRSKLVSL